MSEEKIINRIKKMLALANDLAATEGERDNALRMAFATMAKYNIDMATVENLGSTEPRINFTNESFSWMWAKHVNKIVGELFFCKYYFGRKINGTQVVHHFVGKESNAMTAAVMADWIVKSILKEARSMYKQNTSPETREFALGAMHKLAERAREIRKQAESASIATPGNSLVLASLYKLESDANEAFTADINLKSSSRKISVTGGEAYNRGQEFGSKINLNTQLGGTAKEALRIK